ncbi:MAG TPA: hypothetical protein ENG05_03030, partial [Acidilobales archaeon]|nr:hypothetical protein [Acidilobales archaeon]
AKSSDIFISSNEFRDIIIGICVDHESENITIEHNVFKACLSPIDVAKSHNIIIYNNTVDRAESSITLIDTSNVVIYANLLKNMAWYAVTGIRNKDVIVFGNSVINVRDETFLVSTKITFTSPYKLTYAYKGKEFTSYVGNYWGSKANVTDSNGDGISDKPHSFLLIPSNVATKVTDKYPLVRPHTEYVLPPLFELPRVKLLTKDIEVYAGSNKTISMLITNVNALEKKYAIRIRAPQGINAYGKALISVRPQESLTYNITITVPRGIKEGSYLLKAIIRDLTPIPNTTITKTIPIKVIVDKEPPRIKANVSVSNNTLTLQWLVSDNWGVKRVTVIIDNETLSVGSKGIKRFTLRPGKHELVIRAEDLGGNNATFSKLVEIVKPTPKPTRTVITTITTSITSSVTSPAEVRKPKPEVDMTKFLVLAIIVIVIAAIIIKALRR